MPENKFKIETENDVKLAEEAIEAYRKRNVKWPQIGDSYWYIGADGISYRATYEGSDTACNFRRSMGNFYRTKEELEESRKTGRIAQQQALVRLENAIAEVNGDWVADWRDPLQSRFQYSFNPIAKSVDVEERHLCIFNNIPSIKGQEEAERIAEEYHDDILLALGVSLIQKEGD